MKYKLAADGNIVRGEDGHPVIIQPNGEEAALKAIENHDKIRELTAEAHKYRTRKSELQDEYDTFKDRYSSIEDVEEAMKALETVKGLDSKSLVDAEKANEERQKIEAELKKKMETLQTEHGKKTQGFEQSIIEKDNKIFQLMVSDKFKTTKALKGTTFEPMPGIAISEFGKNFKVEDGDVVGYLNGEKITSSDINEVGKLAPFDDALTQMIDQHPNRDNIRLSGSGGGNGSTPSGNAVNGMIKVSRAQLKNPAQYQKIQSEAAESGAQIQVID